MIVHENGLQNHMFLYKISSHKDLDLILKMELTLLTLCEKHQKYAQHYNPPSVFIGVAYVEATS